MARAKVNEPKELEQEVIEVSLKGVVLKGWGDKKGTHTIHLKKQIVSFRDGKAEVPADLAKELKKAGYIE